LLKQLVPENSLKIKNRKMSYRGEADLSPEMALRLSKAFGRTPESWMQM
jgi:plasmid maintenance system antidote protein VapI